MKFSSIIAALGLSVAGVQALPNGWGNWNGWGADKCISAAQAQSIVDRSIVFLMHTDVAVANATAYGLFSPNIQEFGDSINSLRGDPLGTQVENGITKYVAETLASPAIPKITTLDIIRDCHKFVWQWRFEGIGSDKYRVQGVTIISVGSDGLVDHQYVEFNGLAWGLDIGFTITVPPGLFGPPSK